MTTEPKASGLTTLQKEVPHARLDGRAPWVALTRREPLGHAVEAIRRHWLLVVLLVLNVATHARWLAPGSYLTSGDVGVIPHEAQLQLGTSALSLQTGAGLGGKDLSASLHPLLAAYALLAHAGFSYPVSFKLLVLWPYLVVSTTGVYGLVRQVARTSAGVLVGSCVLLFNTYTLLVQGGSILIMMADALAVLWLSQLLRLTKRGVTRGRLIRFLATGYALSVYEFRVFYIAVALMGLFAVYMAVWLRRWRPVALATGGTGVAVTLNAAWLLALGASGELASNGVAGRGLFGDTYYDLARAVTLFHPFWTGSAPAVFEVQRIPLYFWIIPAAAVTGAIVRRRDRLAGLFVLLTLLGALLSKQSAHPFTHLYAYLYAHLPGFNYFREASKFYIIVAVGYAGLLGLAADWLWEQRARSDLRRSAVTFCVSLLALIFVVNARSLVTGSFGGIFVARQIPDGYQAIARLLREDSGYSRTLWTPQVSRWSPYDLDHPAVGLTEALAGAWSDVPGVAALGQRGLVDALSTTAVHDLVDAAAARYVIVPAADPAGSEDLFGEVPRASYVSALSRLPWLTRVDVGTAAVAVFRNSTWAPPVVAADGVVVRRSLARYDVRVPRLSDETLLTLAVAHDPGWVLSPVQLSAVPACQQPTTTTIQRDHSAASSVIVSASSGESLRSIAANRRVSEGLLMKLNRRIKRPAVPLPPGTSVLVPASPKPVVSTTSCASRIRQATDVGLRAGGRSPDRAARSPESWLASWTLSASDVRTNFPAGTWKANTDGSITLALALIYRPQAVFNQGLLIELAALVVLVAGFLLWPLTSRSRRLARLSTTAAQPLPAPQSSSPASQLLAETWRRVVAAASPLVPAAVGAAALLRVANGARPSLRATVRLAGWTRARALVLRGASLGPGCRVGRGVSVTHAAKVTLGRGVLVASGCRLQAAGGMVLADGVVVNERVRLLSQPRDGVVDAITVGAHAVLGDSSIVCTDVTIGAHAFVAPGAVVTDDVPPGAAVEGNPAAVRQGRATTRGDGLS